MLANYQMLLWLSAVFFLFLVFVFRLIQHVRRDSGAHTHVVEWGDENEIYGSDDED